jgi:L-alanine-DL-glutamate epimerase-like enolase superfamily enzyme
LLGGEKKPVPVYAGGLFLSDPIDAIVEEARRYVAAGFRAMKMRTGAPTASEDIARVEAVRAAIGPDTILMVDVVQGWTVEEAIKRGREIQRFDLFWIEDPVLFDDLDGMAAVAAALDVPVTAGENDYGRRGFRRLIEKRAADILMPDLQRIGGISEWMKTAALADAFGLRVTPHVFPETSVHLMCATPNGLWLEHVPWWDRLFVEPQRIEGGHATPSDRPGLGLAFDWDALESLRIAKARP